MAFLSRSLWKGNKMKKYSDRELKKIEGKIDLTLKFSQFILENPKVLSRIPEGAHVALMPDDDFEIAQENFELVSGMAKKNNAHTLAFIGHRINREEKSPGHLDYRKRPLEV